MKFRAFAPPKNKKLMKSLIAIVVGYSSIVLAGTLGIATSIINVFKSK